MDYSNVPTDELDALISLKEMEFNRHKEKFIELEADGYIGLMKDTLLEIEELKVEKDKRKK